jgi:hypothetical protein
VTAIYSDCRIEKRYLRVSGITLRTIKKKSLNIWMQAIRTTTLDELRKAANLGLNLSADF